MKKKFKMNELQCAHCAAKMEDEINKIPGVESANINFMMQKLTVEADEENFDKIMEEAQKCCDKIEKGVKIVVQRDSKVMMSGNSGRDAILSKM